MNILFVAIGGALGAVARFLSYEMMMKFARVSNFAHFPSATMFVNVLGSLLAWSFANGSYLKSLIRWWISCLIPC